MLIRNTSILLSATLACGYFAIVVVTVLLAAAAPAIAQRSGATLDAWRLGPLGSPPPNLSLTNPGALDLARPVDPNQARNLPGAPSTAAQTPTAPAIPDTLLFPNSNGVVQP
jgi:hypothetical protein